MKSAQWEKYELLPQRMAIGHGVSTLCFVLQFKPPTMAADERFHCRAQFMPMVVPTVVVDI